MQKITPCLWFDDQAEEAARFYTSIFKNSQIGTVSHYGDVGPMPKGTVMVVNFTLDGQQLQALNGGPKFKFSPAISLVVSCETQKEIDHFWEKLSEGGEEGVCGWLTDKFGLSWQIVPVMLGELMKSADEEQSSRVMNAIFQMKKLEIDAMQRACDDSPAP